MQHLRNFCTLHFMLPFVIVSMVMLHILFLHMNESNNPLGIKSNVDKMPFHPYFSIKDLLSFLIMILLFMMMNFMEPYMLRDPDNFPQANPLVTPTHIKPEWYFSFAHAILRSIPNKLGVVVGLVMSILILVVLQFSYNNKFQGLGFYPIDQVMFWLMLIDIMLLTWIGARPVGNPYIYTGMFFKFTYFSYFVIDMMLSLTWDKMSY